MSAVENFGQTDHKRRHWRRWTARELERAAALFASGVMVAEIAGTLGRTEAAVKMMRHKVKYGLVPKAAGRRGEAVASPIDPDRFAAARIDRRAEFAARQRWDEAGLAELAALLAKGLLQSVIAARMGRTDDSIAYGAAILRRRAPRDAPGGAPRDEGARERACLRCGENFLSAGIHNRLCFGCGKWAEEHQNQYGMPSITLTGDARANLRSRDGAVRRLAGS